MKNGIPFLLLFSSAMLFGGGLKAAAANPQVRFAVSMERLENNPRMSRLYGGREGVRRVAEFLHTDPEGRRIRQELIQKRVLPFLKKHRKTEAVSLIDFRNLSTLAFIYGLTGDRETGMEIHRLTMQAAAQGKPFWYGGNRKKMEQGIGVLSNSFAALALTEILTFAGDLFSAEERGLLEKQLREDGMESCAAFLKNQKGLHNFFAVTAVGAYVAAVYFGEEEMRRFAWREIDRYLRSAIEPDGSYGEGVHYFYFPVSYLHSAVAAMSPAERDALFRETPLRNSSAWLVSCYYYPSVPFSGCRSWRLSFGDDNCWEAPDPIVLELMRLFLNDPNVDLLKKRLALPPLSYGYHWRMLFLRSAPSDAMKRNAATPPLLQSFRNGVTILRDSFRDDAQILSLFTGHDTATGQAHQRPESNSINLAAFGVPLILSSGNSNVYGSALSKELAHTASANTVVADGARQASPWVPPYGRRQMSELLLSRAGKNADVIVSEAAASYLSPMKSARRSVVFLRNRKTYVICDRLESEDAPHSYTLTFHLNNFDFRSKTVRRSENAWLYERPELKLSVFFDSDRTIESFVAPALRITPRYPIRNLEKQESERGNAWALSCRSTKKERNAVFFTVLHPFRGGETVVPVRTGSTLKIGSAAVTFGPDEIRVSEDGESEIFTIRSSGDVSGIRKP